MLWQRALELARRRKVWLFNPPAPTPAGTVSKVEINIGEPALAISPAEVTELFGELVS